MNWVIEFQNGKIVEEGTGPFDPVGFKRIYWAWPGHGCGFKDNGHFFVDNAVHDFKIDIMNGIVKPFCHKTGALQFSQSGHSNKIVSWNVGYELLKENLKERYTLSVLPNGLVLFRAERGNDRREIRLC